MKDKREKRKDERGKRKEEPTLRSESRGCLHTLPSREEETPPLWWGKDKRGKFKEERAKYSLVL